MADVVMLTPDPADPSFAGRWREVYERMAEPLAQAGVSVEPRPWTDPGDLGPARLVLALMVWGYHRSGERWTQACRAWGQAGLPLANPASVLAWNADKLYLRGMAEAGVPVVPTRFVDRVTPAEVEAAFAAFGTDRLIAKPRVSANAHQTLRLAPGDGLEGAPEGAAMIQPYLPAIEDHGELSLIYLDGRFSHAIRKRPAAGDFRIQPEYGGLITAETPPAEALAVAEAVLASVEEPLLYARIDLVPGPDGRLCLIEAELIEPDLYLGFDPGRGDGFARAVAARLG